MKAAPGGAAFVVDWPSRLAPRAARAGSDSYSSTLRLVVRLLPGIG